MVLGAQPAHPHQCQLRKWKSFAKALKPVRDSFKGGRCTAFLSTDETIYEV